MAVDIEDAHLPLYHDFEAKEIEDFRANLLKWYWQNRRKLPWRGDVGPFGNAEKTQLPTKKTKADSASCSTPTKTKSLLSFFAKASSSTMITTTETAVVSSSSKSISQTTTTKVAASAQTKAATSATKTTVISSPVTTISPYGVWVSEIMLQQTRVEAVINYYLAFMSTFPTVSALANADIEEVNKLWAGLGYYRRAKMLHDGAKSVMAEHEGNLPSSVEGLKSIPGIGPYTAGAIGSIAFQIRTPLVDGNVIRVLSRVRAVAADPKNKSLIAFCWTLAEALVSPSHPGDFNQALMELGATVCTPTSPKCKECPIRMLCNARREVETKQRPLATATIRKTSKLCEVCAPGSRRGPSSVCEYPHKAEKKEPTPETYVIVVATCKAVKGVDGLCYFLRKRPETGLLAGQWEFPSFLIEDVKKRKKTFDQELKEMFGVVKIISRRSCGEIVHVFSHRKHTMLIETAEVTDTMNKEGTMEEEGHESVSTKKRKKPPSLAGRWVSTSEIDSIGLTTGVKKVLARVRSESLSKK